MGDSELRERAEPWVRRGTAIFQDGKGLRGLAGGREERYNTVMSLGWRGKLKGFMTSDLCSLGSRTKGLRRRAKIWHGTVRA